MENRNEMIILFFVVSIITFSIVGIGLWWYINYTPEGITWGMELKGIPIGGYDAYGYMSNTYPKDLVNGDFIVGYLDVNISGLGIVNVDRLTDFVDLNRERSFSCLGSSAKHGFGFRVFYGWWDPTKDCRVYYWWFSDAEFIYVWDNWVGNC